MPIATEKKPSLYQMATKIQADYRADPIYFSKQWFNSTLWAKQEEVMLAVRDYPRVATRSGNTVGKSRIAAEITKWFLMSHYPSKVITTAPTMTQIQDILWKEIAKLYNSAVQPIGGDLLQTELRFNEEWFALGISTNEVNRFQGFHCLSEDTEILTKRGFLKIDEIDINDEVLSSKVGEKEANWVAIQNIYKYPYEGYLNEYNSKVLSFAVTNEHRFPTKYDSLTEKWSLKRFSELKTKFVIQRKLKWKGREFKVPNEFLEMDCNEFAEFVGFWTGDGGTRRHSKGNFYEVLLYQTSPKGCEYVENLIKKFRYSKKQDYYSISNRSICKWLISNIGRYGKDRIVPRMILDATPEIIMAYLTGLWKAEGTLRKNGKWGQFYNTSKLLIDGVQELLLKLGRPTTVGINILAGHRLARNTCYVLSFTETSTNSVIKKKDVKKKMYKGRVWCISTENKTFVARRNGRCFVSGNSPNLLVIIDEALGVEPMIWEAIEGLHPTRILAIGNPLAPEGEFFKCFTSPLWHKIRISCQECVDWQNKHGRIPGLVTQEWIDERKDDWGEKSPLYIARVLGEFPQEGIDTLVRLADVDKSYVKESVDDEETSLRVISADVATKHGTNLNVIVYRQGHTIKDIEMFQGLPTPEIANRIQQKFSMKAAHTIVIDSDGFGEGVSDILIGRNLPVVEFHGGYAARAHLHTRYRNLRSEYYHLVAKKFEKGVYSLKHLPKHIFEKLKNQLCAVKTRPPDGQGRLQIETKENMLARGMPSPDLADAFVYSEFGWQQGKVGDTWNMPYRFIER